MANFLNDTFTAPDNTLLQNHVADIGGAWSKHPSNTADAVIIGNTLRATGSVGSGNYAAYLSTAAPPSADYTITANVVVSANAGDAYPQIMGRFSTTAYSGVSAGYDQETTSGTPKIYLREYVNGTQTILASAPITLTTGSAHALSLTFDSSTAKVSLDDNVILTSSITASTAGRVGLFLGSNNSLSFDSLSATPAAPVVLPYTRSTLTLGGQPSTLLVPTSYNAAVGAPLAFSAHGATLDQNAFIDDTQNAGGGRANVTLRLIQEGYIVASSMAHGDAWGNAAAINDYVALYTALASSYNLSATVAVGESMGGLTMLNLLSDGRVPLRGLYLLNAVCNLRSMYELGTCAASLRAAYGLANAGSDYFVKTQGRDPLRRSPLAFGGEPLRFVASYDDTYVLRTKNCDALAPLLAPYATETGIVTSTGEHTQNPDNFQPDDVSAFFARARNTPSNARFLPFKQFVKTPIDLRVGVGT